MNSNRLCVFAGPEGWRCVIMNGKARGPGYSFKLGPEEHLRSFLRGKRVKRVWAVLSDEGAILRFAKLPALKKRDMKDALPFLYDSSFPIDKGKYVFGSKVLSNEPGKCLLMLAALPLTSAGEMAALFKRMGMRLEKLSIFEGLGGLRLSQFGSVLVFVKQKSTWRAVWMKNQMPIDAWRVGETRDLRALFAELEEQVDNALFYNPPEAWLTEACEDCGLNVSEALDPLDIFDDASALIDMLPPEMGPGKAHSRALAFMALALLLLSLACAAFWLATDTEKLKTRHNELSERIRGLNDGLQNTAAEPFLEAENIEYGRVLQILTGSLPPGAYVKNASASDGAVRLSVNAGDGAWVQQYIDVCSSGLGLNVQSPKFSQKDGIMEIEIFVELR